MATQKAGKRPLFYERFTYKVQGTSRSYTKICIVVWENETERTWQPRVTFEWMVMDHVPECGDFSRPDVKVNQNLWEASACLRLALRLSERLKRTYSSHATPGDLQAMLARLGATKCCRDERGDTQPIALEVARPA